MHWVLQENLFNEKEWDALIGALERFSIPYSVHKVVPFVGELIPPAEPKHPKVICFGSYAMRHVAKANGWQPGVYDIFEKNFLVQHRRWGDQMLNADSQVMEFAKVFLTEPRFIRPIDDSKYFAGRVFDPEEWNEWRHKIVDLGDDYGNNLSSKTLVQVCEPKEIWSEYRYWIVDGHIVTRSQYKLGSRVVYSKDVDSRFDLFVAGVATHPDFCIGAYCPAKAFVIDVCETPNGIKIVEINTINSAGFYAADMQDIVIALEAMENPRTSRAAAPR